MFTRNVSFANDYMQHIDTYYMDILYISMLIALNGTQLCERLRVCTLVAI